MIRSAKRMAWDIFQNSGSISYYLLYRALTDDKQDKDRKDQPKSRAQDERLR